METHIILILFSIGFLYLLVAALAFIVSSIAKGCDNLEKRIKKLEDNDPRPRS